MSAQKQPMTKERFDGYWTPEPFSGCWLWTRATFDTGYGALWSEGRTHSAQRISWTLHKGEIPQGLFVCHTCDTPACVNPAHLFLGSNAENIADSKAKGRLAKGERHGSAKLTETQVLAIRSDKRPQRKIARDYGVSQTHIGKIKQGKNWKYLPNAN